MNKTVPCLIALGLMTLSVSAAETGIGLRERTRLFVDDAAISRREGVTRRLHPCAKLDTPVLTPQKPWEGADDDSRVYLYGTVLDGGPGGELRMWYNRKYDNLYATSKDGIHWHRPDLGLVSWEDSTKNNLLPLRLHSPSVLFDPLEKDPNRRYKMAGSAGRRIGYCSSFSPDGLHWTPPKRIVPGSDTCTLAQDPKTGEYLFYFKRSHPHRGQTRRLVYLTASKDMEHWSEPRLVLAPDDRDDQQTQREGGISSQFYNLSVFAYGDQFLGMVTHFRYHGPPKDRGPEQSMQDGPIDAQLVHSRDGREWRRFEDRTPIIPNGPHAYDAGCILGVANRPVIVGDEMWMYYTAINTTHGGCLPKKQVAIARAAWRLDGFVSLDAGQQPGLVETQNIDLKADHLVVNANAGSGELRVEVLDASGTVVPGYEREACVGITSDSVRQKVAWKQHDRLPERQDPIRLRFLFHNASLYSYTLE